MINDLKSRLDRRRHDGEADRGDLVQTVLLVAGFAIAAILVVTWVGGAIINKGADSANCIESANTYTSNSAATSQADCQKSVSKDNSFKNDNGYKNRY